MKLLATLIVILLLTACQSTKQRATLLASSPRIILKLDDLKVEASGDIHLGWIQVIDLLDERNIPASIGLICSSLAAPTDEYLAWIAQRKADGHEFWNHGFCHCQETLDDGTRIREFRGKPYDEQLSALVDGQRLAKEKLGFAFTAFGAPYNSTDSSTALAINRTPDLKHWIYKETDFETALKELPRTPVNIEYPVHVPNLDSLQHYFKQHRTEEVLIIQGHPRSWIEQPERMKNFVEILDYLVGEGCSFVRIEDLE